MRIPPVRPFALLTLFLLLTACGSNRGNGPHHESPEEPRPELLSGGSATVFDISSNAYRSPLPFLSDEDVERHLAGDALFGAKFVTSPARVHPGLGPLFNHTNCEGCHIKDGRGAPILNENGVSQLIIMTSLATGTPDDPNGPVPVPGIGLQIQDHAVFGQTPNATATISWEEVPGTYVDGTPYSLRKPHLVITTPPGSPAPADFLISPRQPVSVFGLGLLEAVSDAQLFELATRPDKLPGRVSMVYSRQTKTMLPGRFGRKAGKSSLREQIAKALFLDIGITNEFFPATTGEAQELSNDDLDTLEFYLRTLAVPARRDVRDSEVLDGQRLFLAAGCDGCHLPSIETGEHTLPFLSYQKIAPYTDLLLHDLGEGLADNRPEFTASGREWRTAALWGIGLQHTVHSNATFLHDGRARTFEEAILWHGGQADAAREAFRAMSARERKAMTRFLQSL